MYAGTGGTATVTMEIGRAGPPPRSGTVKTDSSVKTYNGSGTLIQTLTWTGAFAYGSGTTYKSRNPLNPPSSPGKSKVVVTLGNRRRRLRQLQRHLHPARLHGDHADGE